MKLPVIISSVLLWCAMPVTAAPLSPPAVINYQGRVMQNGTNFNGTGQFKFMLLNQKPGIATTRVIWKNDGTVTTAEPTTAVTLQVQDGQFTAPLGNTSITGMLAELPGQAFGTPEKQSVINSEGMSLRIWFRPGATGSFVQFTPDIAVNSVPFALTAASVGGKAAADVVTQGSPLQITGALPGPAPDVTISQSVVAQHNVAGLDFFRSPVRIEEGGTDWTCAVLSGTDASVSFFDFNDSPDTLVRRAFIRDNVGGFNRLSGPTDMVVSLDQVYVTSGTEDALTALTYEGTSHVATLRFEIVDGVGGFNDLDDAAAVVRLPGSAELLAVASPTSSAISIIRVQSNVPALVSVINAASLSLTGFTGPTALAVQTDNTGRILLYAACPSTNTVFAFDVTSPEFPALRWSRNNGTSSFSTMTGPSRFGRLQATSGADYLPVLCPAANVVYLLHPADGTLVSRIANGTGAFASIVNPVSATVEDGTLLIACRGSNSMVVADLADPVIPRIAQVMQDGVGGFTALGGCSAVYVDAPIDGGFIRYFILGETEHALTVTNRFVGPTASLVSLTTNGNMGAGTKRPHVRFEAFQGTECAARVATSAAGDAALQLLEYEPTNDETPFGYEWRYDGGNDTLLLNAVGFAGNAGLKASFSKTGNMVLQGTLTQGSDRNRKENIVPVDPAAVLEKVAALPVAEWNYRGETDVRHVGPMSQDFRAAFGLGDTDKGIAAVDADGVALASIKALKAELDALRKENADMRARLEKLEAAPRAQK